MAVELGGSRRGALMHVLRAGVAELDWIEEGFVHKLAEESTTESTRKTAGCILKRWEGSSEFSSTFVAGGGPAERSGGRRVIGAGTTEAAREATEMINTCARELNTQSQLGLCGRLVRSGRTSRCLLCHARRSNP